MLCSPAVSMMPRARRPLPALHPTASASPSLLLLCQTCSRPPGYRLHFSVTACQRGKKCRCKKVQYILSHNHLLLID